jgi:hypothetical protein
LFFYNFPKKTFIMLGSDSCAGVIKMNRIGRRGFIGGAAAGVGAAAVGMAGRARAIGGDEPWENRLIPTGIARLDYENLKNAIARGGTIRMMRSDRKSGATFFNLVNREQPLPPIEITRDVSIVGQGTLIAHNNFVFTCKSKVKITIRNIHFSMFDKNTPNPIDIEKPANHASVTLNLINVALGNDDPWD